MKRWILLVTAAAMFMGPGLAGAADEPEKVAEMVVTATRSEMPRDKIGGSTVTVITAEDIESPPKISKQKTCPVWRTC